MCYNEKLNVGEIFPRRVTHSSSSQCTNTERHGHVPQFMNLVENSHVLGVSMRVGLSGMQLYHFRQYFCCAAMRRFGICTKCMRWFWWKALFLLLNLINIVLRYRKFFAVTTMSHWKRCVCLKCISDPQPVKCSKFWNEWRIKVLNKPRTTLPNPLHSSTEISFSEETNNFAERTSTSNHVTHELSQTRHFWQNMSHSFFAFGRIAGKVQLRTAESNTCQKQAFFVTFKVPSKDLQRGWFYLCRTLTKDRVWDSWLKGTARSQLEQADFTYCHGHYENCEMIHVTTSILDGSCRENKDSSQ